MIHLLKYKFHEAKLQSFMNTLLEICISGKYSFDLMIRIKFRHDTNDNLNISIVPSSHPKSKSVLKSFNKTSFEAFLQESLSLIQASEFLKLEKK